MFSPTVHRAGLATGYWLGKWEGGGETEGDQTRSLTPDFYEMKDAFLQPMD